MGCSEAIKIVFGGKERYYQSFWGEDGNFYRLYDENGEFLKEFTSADDMTDYLVGESSKSQKNTREYMQESFMRNMEKLKGDMSDSKFSAHCGLKYESCYQYLTGRRFPTVHALAQIADSCGVTIDWLVGREKDDAKG